MSDGWVEVPATDVRAGDRVRLASGVELTVSRVDSPFLGRTDLVKLVESTDQRWLAQGVPVAARVHVQRDA